MSVKAIALLGALGLVTAAPHLTATGARIGDHPGFVRVVVDFNGRVPANQVVFDRLSRRTAALHIEHPGIVTSTSGGSGSGVRVALQPSTQGLNVSLSSWARRFKYVSYAVVGGSRLAIDLWKSAPPANTNQTSCRRRLSLRYVDVSGGIVSAKGAEYGIFENQFQVVVRGAHGIVLGRKHVTGPRAWASTVKYTTSHPQLGTVEAVALSAKDGSLECIAQTSFWFPAS